MDDVIIEFLNEKFLIIQPHAIHAKSLYAVRSRYYNPTFEVNPVDVRRYAVRWQDILDYETVLPEHKEKAENITLNLLGYILYACPLRCREDVKIRKEFEEYQSGRISLDGLFAKVEDILRYIRNAEMRLGDISKLELNDADIEMYTSEKLVPYSQAARDRLAGFLGYYPDLRYSLTAEMLVRTFLAADQPPPPDKIMPYDLYAVCIVKYREILLTEGQEAADASPLTAYETAMAFSETLSKKKKDAVN